MMSVQNMAWNWAWAFNSSQSLQVNFGPTQAVALCSLSQADGGGLVAGGITQYRTRSQANGPDQDHDFSISGETYWLPPMAYDPIMTSVTAELDTGQDQQGTMTLMVWLWS
jgi:hypothetical protein